ncbi:MAG: DNA polymerase IV [bacterium]|nr:DNA polymerase IV [bacterium]
MFQLPLEQTKRQILHIDADAFFASVEQILNPKLRSKPLLVGGPNSTRGIVSAASYEARAFGIKSGMPMYLAKKKCPKAVVVPGHFDAYRDFSKRIYQILIKHTPDVEMASIDEAYLDITGYPEMFGESPELFAKMILMETYGKTGISVSCGLASNKTVAKVASSQNKPHKLTVVPYGSEKKFLAPLELRALPGIGPRTYSLLEKFGLRKLGDFSALSLAEVMDHFGIQWIPLWKRSMGIDNSQVISSASLPKSISKERTFYQSVSDNRACLKKLKELAAMVFAKLRSHNLKARTVFVRIRYKRGPGGRDSFDDFTFQKVLEIPSSMDSKLFPAIKDLFLRNVENGEVVRLVGIGVTQLYQNYNLNLFENDEGEDNLFYTIDRVNKLYGDNKLRYGI